MLQRVDGYQQALWMQTKLNMRSLVLNQVCEGHYLHLHFQFKIYSQHFTCLIQNLQLKNLAHKTRLR